MVPPVVITDYFKPVQPRRLNLFRGINKKIVFFMKDKMAIIMQNHPFTKKTYQMRMTDYYPTIIFNTYDFGQTKITNYFNRMRQSSA